MAVVLIAALAAACAGPRPTPTGSVVTSPLLSPSTLGSSVNASQVLRVAFGDREATLNCAVAVTAERITLVGVTAMGMRAFTIKYDGVKVDAESAPGMPESLPPERLLNDVQLVYWPLKALQSRLSSGEWEVSEPMAGTRRLKRSGRVVAEVHYANSDPWSGRAWLANLEFGYTLSIDSQRVESK